MLRLERTEVFGWEAAIRGMRNPKNSWSMSDSKWEFVEAPSSMNPNDKVRFVVGENDMKLAKTLAQAGSDHGKFLRMIVVTVDLTAPLYWWKEFDTYKVGTVANSCSTMHKIHAKKFDLDDFSHEHLMGCCRNELRRVADLLNACRAKFIETKEKSYWWQMIQLLPSSYNQRRTVQLNYEVLRNMYHARKNHKLDEWHTFCDWIEGLPYFKEIVLEG